MKLLGKPTLTESNEQIEVSYDTTFYSNSDDRMFMHKLVTIGAYIIDMNRKYVRCILPKGWKHIKLSKTEEFIIDQNGYRRIIMNRTTKKSMIRRRYDFAVHMLKQEKGDDPAEYAVLVQFTDKGIVYDEGKMDTEMVREIMQEGDTDNMDDVIAAISEATAMELDREHPEWRDETKYWED